jgi:putative phosphotransacetylase
MSGNLVQVGLSSKHVHLSRADIDALFGEGYELTVMKDLSQPGQYAANEKIEVVGPKGSAVMRVLGPARKNTQVEVAVTDCFGLGIKPVVKDSGDVNDTPGIKLVGPKGEVDLPKGVMVASRHVHMHTGDAERFGVKDKDIVRVRTTGERAVVFENVLVRVSDKYALEIHLDTDEGNAALLKNGQMLEIVKYENE